MEGAKCLGETEIDRTTEVNREMGALDQQVGNLEEEVKFIVDRLRLITREEEPVDVAAKGLEEPSMVGHAIRIRGLSKRVTDCVTEIRSLRERIEL